DTFFHTTRKTFRELRSPRETPAIQPQFMQTRSKTSGYIIRSAAVAVLLLPAIVGFTSAIPGRVVGRATQTKTLTFADRVAYQRAIEEVYCRHSIWPSANASAKPPLDKVLSQAQIEQKVQDYLRKAKALEEYWQKPIAPDQLQAELERMATHTKR